MIRFTLNGFVVLLLTGSQALAQGPSEDPAKLKARIEKLEADNAALKKGLAQLQARLAALENKLGKGPSVATPAAPQAVVKDFFEDLARGRDASAYAAMTAAYRKKTERAAFDAFVDNNPVLRLSLHVGGEYKFRSTGKGFECDYLSQRVLDNAPFVNIVLRIIEEDGAWKIDEFLETKDFRKKKK